MKPGHLDTASKTELGHINTIFYWFMNLKMNVDYKTTLVPGQPTLDCMVPYLNIQLASDNKNVKISNLLNSLGHGI